MRNSLCFAPVFGARIKPDPPRVLGVAHTPPAHLKSRRMNKTARKKTVEMQSRTHFATVLKGHPRGSIPYCESHVAN